MVYYTPTYVCSTHLWLNVVEFKEEGMFYPVYKNLTAKDEDNIW